MRKVAKIFGVLAVILGLAIGFSPAFQPLKDTIAEAASVTWQCSKCGQQLHMSDRTSPRQGFCPSGGYHVWQRIK